MKKILSALAIGLGVLSAPAVTPPYSSDFFRDVAQIDEGWTSVNNGSSKAQKWDYDRDANFNLVGKSGGASKVYDADYAANCWLISPAVTLEAGTTYTMTVLAKTRGSDEESFEVRLGNEATTASLSAGQELYRNANLFSPTEYTTISKEFTVTESGDYYFGFHCFSPAGHWELCITGFSVTDGTGGGGDEPGPDPDPDPDPEPDPDAPASLPWSYSFESSIDGWTVANGPETTSTSKWEYRTYSSAIVMDFAQGIKEDHWAISPAINFAEAGTYALEAAGSLYGTLAFRLGTNPQDLSSFTQEIGKTSLNQYDYSGKYVFEVETPGVYHVALHACAESGSYMGYRIQSVKVHAETKAPVNITDLKVKVFESPLQAELSATYPAVYNNGKPLEAISKAEICRDGVVIHTVTSPEPGSTLSYVDAVEAPGNYTYSVKIYSTDGVLPADEPMQVKSGYIGKPFMDMPTEPIELVYMTEAEKDKWLYDGWKYGYYYLESEGDTSTGTADNSVVSPYIHFEPGHYRLVLNLRARENGYTVSITDNRTDLSDGLTTIFDCPEEEEYGYLDRNIDFAIEEAGDYAFVIHHYKSSTYTWSNKIELNTFFVKPTFELPLAVTAFTGEVNEECTEAVLKWTNPTETSFGNPIEGTITLTVKRDNEVLSTLSGTAGQNMVYVDQTVDDQGKHTYSVTASNENGAQEVDSPSLVLNFEKPATFPYTADFNEWNIPGYGNYWSVNEDGWLSFRESSSGYSDYAVSPLMEFKADENYEVTAVFESSTAPVNMRFGAEEDGSEHSVIYTFPAPADENEETMKMQIRCTTGAEPSPVSDDADDNENPVSQVNLAPAKGYLSMHMAGSGKVNMKSFSIVKLKNEESAVETIFAASEGLTYANGIVRLPQGTDTYSVTDLSGKVLCSGSAAEYVDLEPYSGTLIVSADVNGRTSSIKIIK